MVFDVIDSRWNLFNTLAHCTWLGFARGFADEYLCSCSL